MDDATPAPPADGRAPIELKVEYKRAHSFFADYTRNISRGWTFIKTSRPLPVGTEFIFRLSVPGLERSLAIHGEVQRILTAGDAEANRVLTGEGGGAGMAIRFVYRQGDSRAEISRLVDGLMVRHLGHRHHARLLAAGVRRAQGDRSAP